LDRPDAWPDYTPALCYSIILHMVPLAPKNAAWSATPAHHCVVCMDHRLAPVCRSLWLWQLPALAAVPAPPALAAQAQHLAQQWCLGTTWGWARDERKRARAPSGVEEAKGALLPDDPMIGRPLAQLLAGFRVHVGQVVLPGGPGAVLVPLQVVARCLRSTIPSLTIQ
jgi:hypothetical protein